MRILIVAATQPEIEPLFAVDSLQFATGSEQSAVNDSNAEYTNRQLPIANCKLLITGVGMVATAFALGKHLAVNHYDLAINLGIAGSFDRSLHLGEVVEITHDTLAELGAEDDADFLPIEQLGFGEGSFSAGTSLAALNLELPIKRASAITVNKVHGNEHSIHQITQRLQPQVESMEGAAFFYACHLAGIPSLQIRAVSNYVEKRNRDSWQIGLAIKNLNTFAEELIAKLNPQFFE